MNTIKTKDCSRILRAALATLMVASTMTVAFVANPATAEARETDLQYARLQTLAGNDRFHTAQLMVASELEDRSYSGAIVATGDNFPDALAASYLAGLHNHRIVLVQKDKVPATALTALKAMMEKCPAIAIGRKFEVFLLGSTKTISDKVVQSLQTSLGANAQVERIGGTDRYETNRKIIAKANSEWLLQQDTCIIASGDNFPDALSVSPLAAAKHIPIILVGKTLDSKQAAVVKDYKKAIIVGGNPSVTPAVQKSIENLGLSTVRWSGDNRYATSLDIAKHLIADYGLKLDNFIYTTGENYPDALAAGALANQKSTIVLLINSSKASANTLAWLATNRHSVNDYRQAGGYPLAADKGVPASVKAALYVDPNDGKTWVVDQAAWVETIEHPAEYEVIEHYGTYKTVAYHWVNTFLGISGGPVLNRGIKHTFPDCGIELDTILGYSVSDGLWIDERWEGEYGYYGGELHRPMDAETKRLYEAPNNVAGEFCNVFLDTEEANDSIKMAVSWFRKEYPGHSIPFGNSGVRYLKVITNIPWTEIGPETKAAYTETINHPEIGHWESW